MGNDLLKSGLELLGIDSLFAEKLMDFLNELQLWNPRYKLVSAVPQNELIIRHVLDSLAPWRQLEAGKEKLFFDVGSGGGFPGIPLAICFPVSRFVLIERSGRRVRFLNTVVQMLSLANVRVWQEDYRTVRQKADTVIFRAVSPLNASVVGDFGKLTAEEAGSVCAYKGRRVVIEKEIVEAGLEGNAEILPVKVPYLDEERNLVRFR